MFLSGALGAPNSKRQHYRRLRENGTGCEKYREVMWGGGGGGGWEQTIFILEMSGNDPCIL